MSTSSLSLLAYRAVGAAMLDRGMYEGIEADARATRQALTIVLLSSLAAGFGAGGLSGPRPAVLAAFSGLALLTWAAWAVLILQIGGRWLPGPRTRVDLGQLLRTTGFAAAPGLLQAAAAVTTVALPIFALAWIWMFAAMVVAVRQALDYASLGRAVAVCGLALLVTAVLAVGFALLLTRSVS